MSSAEAASAAAADIPSSSSRRGGVVIPDGRRGGASTEYPELSPPRASLGVRRPRRYCTTPTARSGSATAAAAAAAYCEGPTSCRLSTSSPGSPVAATTDSLPAATVASPQMPQGGNSGDGSSDGGSIEAEFEFIKRRTGWHPYVWYLMCRRPELYGVGIRARVVARVAGWEWDEIQKVPDLLRTFLRRIDAFVAENPVPRCADKKEAKEYKHFAANSVRTPWFQVETPAVRRALRDMEGSSSTAASTAAACGASVADSDLSDGGSSGPLSASSGQLTPMVVGTSTHVAEEESMEAAPNGVVVRGSRMPLPSVDDCCYTSSQSPTDESVATTDTLMMMTPPPVEPPSSFECPSLVATPAQATTRPLIGGFVGV